MSNKTIQITPQFFSHTRRPTRKKNITNISEKSLKSKLLSRMNRIKTQEKTFELPDISTGETDEFTQSVDFLDTLDKIKRRQLLERKTLRAPQKIPQPQYAPNVDTGNLIPVSPLALPKDSEIPFGNLKGGNKPTYRTQLSVAVEPKKDVELPNLCDDKTPTTSVLANSETNGTVNVPFQIPKTKRLVGVKYIKRHIRRRTYTLGKNKIRRRVSVMIKNANTRKNINKLKIELSQTNLDEMKNYLYRRNLLTRGTPAPVDVIRKLYESSMLSGDIYNKEHN